MLLTQFYYLENIWIVALLRVQGGAVVTQQYVKVGMIQKTRERY